MDNASDNAVDSVPNHIAELDNDRILFVSMKTGKIFFDCHPAEARHAKKAIAQLRSNGKAKGFAQEIDEVRYAVRQSNEEIKPWHRDYGHPITVNFISDTFAELEKEDYVVSHIILTPLMYAGIRNFGKSVYDEETSMEMLKVGVFGYMWTSIISIDSKLDGFNYAVVATKRLESYSDHETKTVKSKLVRLDEPKVLRYMLTQDDPC